MEPYEAITVFESALRDSIEYILGDAWRGDLGADKLQRLSHAQETEREGRPEVFHPIRDLDYLYTLDLVRLVKSNWDKFAPVFRSKSMMYAYCSILIKYRNAVAHGRTLAPFEENLLVGAAGQVQALWSHHLGKNNPRGFYYPVIESLVDDIGRPGLAAGQVGFRSSASYRRVPVGVAVSFRGRASAPRSGNLTWGYSVGPATGVTWRKFEEISTSESLSFDYSFREEDVREDLRIVITIINSSRFHRYPEGVSFDAPRCDDYRHFYFSVNPPRWP